MNVATQSSAKRPTRVRRGLTLVELTIGMAITAVVMVALATFVNAVSAGWRSSDAQFKDRGRGDQSSARLRDVISNTLAIVEGKPGDASGGSAYLLFWKSDTWGGTADGKAQFGELALIEYDPVTKALWLYQPKDVSTMTTAQRAIAADVTWADDEDNDTSYAAALKSSGVLLPRTPLVGGAMGDGGVQITNAQFGYSAAANGRPIVTYQLALLASGSTTAVYDNIVLRAAQMPSNLNFEDDN